MTGLEVEIVRELVTFIQLGTPTGTMCAHGYLVRVTAGSMLAEGPEGPSVRPRLRGIRGPLRQPEACQSG
jgi:hypothetical protein